MHTLGLGDSPYTIHYHDSRAHYSNTIVSDCTIHLLGYLRYVTKRIRVKCLCLRTNLNTFFVDSSVDWTTCANVLFLSAQMREYLLRFTALHHFLYISAISCTLIHMEDLNEHTTLCRQLRR